MKDVKKVIKKYQITKIIIFILIIALGVYIAYDRIFSEEDYQQAISHTNIEEIKKDEVILPMLPPKTFSPIASKSADVQYIGRLVYSRLFKFDQNMTPQNDLADTVSFNGKNVDIKLKSAKWHKGGNVTAQDIIFTVQAINDYGKKGPYFDKVDKIENITGQGKNLKITFKDPLDISLADLSFPIVNHEDYTKDFEKDNKVIPQGSGMYKVKKYNKGKSIKYIPNNGYYGDIPKSNLIVNFHKKSSSFTTLVETSNISAYYTKDNDIETKVTKPNVKIQSFPSNNLDFIGFNTKDSVCKNGYLRRGLIHAIDMETIRDDFYYDSMIPSDSLYMPGYLDAEKISNFEEDLELAIKFLKKGKIEDYNGDGQRELVENEDINLKILVDSSKKERVYTAEGLEDFFDDIGISSTVVKVNSDQYMEKLKKGDFDLYIGGINIDETMDFRPLLATDGKLNYTGFSNEELDNKMNQFMSGKNIEENKVIVEEIKQIIKNKIPYYPIGYHKYKIVKAPSLNGELEPNFINPYRGISGWNSIYKKVIQEDNQEDKDIKDEK